MTSAASCKTRLEPSRAQRTPVMRETTSAKLSEMLDIDRRPNVYTGIEQFFDILPALGVPAVGALV